jgi:hypothetical protein
LVASGQLRLAMQLALDPIKRGSHQVEMSDEGLMAEDIEDCSSVRLARGGLGPVAPANRACQSCRGRGWPAGHIAGRDLPLSDPDAGTPALMQNRRCPVRPDVITSNLMQI